MWYYLVLENFHFAIALFASVVCAAAAWLYFDAWTLTKTVRDGLKIIGFTILALSFLVTSAVLESTIIPHASSMLGSILPLVQLKMILRIVGYVFLIAGLVSDPIEPKPKSAGVESELKKQVMLPVAVSQVFIWSVPILPLGVALLYLRRAIVGLEKHLKRVAIGFFIVAASELLSLVRQIVSMENSGLYELTAPFGPVWIMEYGTLLGGMALLAHWVFGYLTRRFVTQIFIIFTATVIFVFLTTTATFSAILLRNIESESLAQTGVTAKVFREAIHSKEGELLSDAQTFAVLPEVAAAIADESRGVLPVLAEEFLLAKNLTNLAIMNKDGVVIARGEDKDKVGDSLSGDPVVKRALTGNPAVSIISTEGILAPVLIIRAGYPITSNDKKNTLGTVLVGYAIDTAFVDSLKKATGLDASIYGGNKISATTYTSPDGKSRLIGLALPDAKVNQAVLKDGQGIALMTQVGDERFLAAFEPLQDIDKENIGMVFVGRSEIGMIQTAGRALEYTFLMSMLLILLSLLPAWLISKYIAYQVG